MILGVQHRVHEAVSSAIRQRFGIGDVPAFAVETPPSRTMGDLSVTVAFQLARTLRKPPKAIAQEIVDALVEVPGISRVQAAPNGYLNLFLDRPAFAVARPQVAHGRQLGPALLRHLEEAAQHRPPAPARPDDADRESLVRLLRRPLRGRAQC